MEMTETIPVVNVDESRETAYDMGFDKFADVPMDAPEELDLEGFRSGAEYANHVLPRLRALAGYGDRGHGTYNERRDAAVIEEHQADDVPAEADVMDCAYLLDEVSTAWEKGVRDAVEGNDRYESIEFWE